MIMNFLAHVFLSFNDDEITIGNFIADSIRANKFKHLPPRIIQGITLHRAIDTFTDSHKIPKISSKRLHKNYSHYSRVIVDIYYDHFLAKNWLRYSDVPLNIFAGDFYTLLESNYEFLPIQVKRMMPYMIKDNWLLNYGNLEGIAKVLEGMNRRTKNRSKMHLANIDLEKHYELFEEEFTLFFEELLEYTKAKFKTL